MCVITSFSAIETIRIKMYRMYRFIDKIKRTFNYQCTKYNRTTFLLSCSGGCF